MTSENLHDAITLLPSDLIAETDQQRSSPRTPLRWQRYAAMAACFALVICGSMWCIQYLGLGGAKEAAAEAPAAMQIVTSNAADAVPAEAAPKEAAAEEVEAEAIADPTRAIAGAAQDSHSSAAYADTPRLTLYVDGSAYELSGDDAGSVTAILTGLDYSKENLCECIAEITAVIAGGTEYHINLEEGFVRCSTGQAKLTQEQLDALHAILIRHYP